MIITRTALKEKREASLRNIRSAEDLLAEVREFKAQGGDSPLFFSYIICLKDTIDRSQKIVTECNTKLEEVHND